MNIFKLKKIHSTVIVALALAAFVTYGCDTGTTTTTTTAGTTGLCTERVSVSNTREAKLYYPCDISSVVGATTMSAGYTCTLSDVEFISKAVAEDGYVVLAFTPTNIYGMVTGWRAAHKSAIYKLTDLNNTHSVLKGKINTAKLQTCGHSKGGGGSLWAASELGGTVKSAIGMAPYQGYEFSSSSLRGITAATFIQAAGRSDYLATPAMTLGEYYALPNGISKAYKRHAYWGHLDWMNATGPYRDTITDEVIAWMRYYLDDDTTMASTITDQAGVDAYVWVK